MTSVRLGPSRSASAPQHEAHHDRDEREQQQDHVGRRVRDAEGLGRDHAHHHDHGVDRIRIEEAADEEPAEAGHGPRVLDRAAELPERPHDVRDRQAVRRLRRRLVHEQEDRDGEDEEQERGQAEPVHDRDVEQEDRQPDEDRPAVADGGADPGHPPARLRIADGLERRVVVDERRLVREVGDDEERQAEERRHVRDEEGRADAERGEEQQEGHPPPTEVRDRAEDRRHQGVDADAHDDRDRQEHVAVALAELLRLDQVQPDRPGHHREAEDRVREVVEGPGDRHPGLAAGRQAAEPAGACRRAARRGTAGRGGVSHRAMIEGVRWAGRARRATRDRYNLAR